MRNQTRRQDNLTGKVVVIAGASSGIGQATALEFARRGASLVLGARRENLLAELAATCVSLGGKATFLQTDVTDADAVKRLAEHAISHYEHIDVWINNAGAGVMGIYDEVPIHVHARVIQTSLMGHLNGAHAVLPHFKKRKAGILINTISIGAYVPEVYSVAYTASKYGLRGYSEALRAELAPWPEIKICDVFPAYIDTPGFQHAGNYTGKKLRPVPPVYQPERVAKAMVDLAIDPRPSVIVGESGHLMRWSNALFPRMTRWSLKLVMDNYFNRAKPAAVSNGALFEPMQVGSGASGGWRSKKENTAVNVAAGVFAIGVAAGFALMFKRK